MSFRPIYEGWDVPGRLSRKVRQTFTGIGLNKDLRGAATLAEQVRHKLQQQSLTESDGQFAFAESIVAQALKDLVDGDPANHPLRDHLTTVFTDLIHFEGWFAVPNDFDTDGSPTRSELWELEDHLKRVEKIVDNLDEVAGLSVALLTELASPILQAFPNLSSDNETNADSIRFETDLIDLLNDPPSITENLVQLPFVPDLEAFDLTPRLKERLQYNLHIASGGAPSDSSSVRTPKLPTKQPSLSPRSLIDDYLGGTPLADLLGFSIPIELQPNTRFEHHHIVAGSGHGKTQTLQHLILHDLEAVKQGRASIIVIDSQSDLINNIAGMEMFAPGQSLADRLVLIDPTDIEYPVALNLFDVGMDRLDGYSKLDRERLTNSILELYDFVLGSLLDAGMTQKQTVIFRYITRLLLRIPNATIHTLRELLEDGGYERYEKHILELEGSARAFFENEFNSSEFKRTKQQVLRRLYGILENQTFERMFSHPKSKLDLFAELNTGKVILINTAKDLLKENGTEIFGRFFIAMIAQAAQERAVLAKEGRLPTYVYVDEANDYFDRNTGIILSQARKYNVGMVLAHQYLGQLDAKLQEAIAANTSIKFAGGVSAKDARSIASDLRTDASFIEQQEKLTFAAFIKGQTKRAISLKIEPGRLESLPRMGEVDRDLQREMMREKYAVHYSELNAAGDAPELSHGDSELESDDGKPDVW